MCIRDRFAASAKQQDMLIIFPFAAIILIVWLSIFMTRNARINLLTNLIGLLVIGGMIGSVFFIAEKNVGGDNTVSFTHLTLPSSGLV